MHDNFVKETLKDAEKFILSCEKSESQQVLLLKINGAIQYFDFLLRELNKTQKISDLYSRQQWPDESGR